VPPGSAGAADEGGAVEPASEGESAGADGPAALAGDDESGGAAEAGAAEAGAGAADAAEAEACEPADPAPSS
jgi:hypothetical protein